jgi:hypothetical protein
MVDTVACFGMFDFLTAIYGILGAATGALNVLVITIKGFRHRSCGDNEAFGDKRFEYEYQNHNKDNGFDNLPPGFNRSDAVVFFLWGRFPDIGPFGQRNGLVDAVCV